MSKHDKHWCRGALSINGERHEINTNITFFPLRLQAAQGLRKQDLRRPRQKEEAADTTGISVKCNMSPCLTYCLWGGGLGVGGEGYHSLYLPLSHLQQVCQTRLSDERSLLSLELKQKREEALNPGAQPPPLKKKKKKNNRYTNKLTASGSYGHVYEYIVGSRTWVEAASVWWIIIFTGKETD